MTPLPPWATTFERQGKIDFIDYLKNGTAILAPTSQKQDQLTTEQLCGLNVGYGRGSSQQGNLEKIALECEAKAQPKLEISGYPSPGAGILSVKSGEADAFWGDLPQMLYNVKSEPGLFKIVYTEQKSVLGIGLNKDNPELRDALEYRPAQASRGRNLPFPPRKVGPAGLRYSRHECQQHQQARRQVTCPAY